MPVEGTGSGARVRWVAASDVAAERIEAFLEQLDEERRTFHTPTARVLDSDILSVACRGETVVGLSGVHRYWGTPVCYLLVGTAVQGGIHGYALSQRGLAAAKGRYPFLLAIITPQGQTMVGLARKQGFLRCLPNHRYVFLFRPLRWWSLGLYPIYALLFPPLFLGFYFRRDRIRRVTARNAG